MELITVEEFSLLVHFVKESNHVQDDTKKRELLKTPPKIEEIQEKKIIDRN